MAKYTIAWLPGDGVGKEVMAAARLVLDRLDLDARYVSGDIGWEFWKSEGNPLPERTVEMLKATDCALFGAITSKPKEEAEKELDPSLRGKGYVYYSPIVQLRQMFDLYTNMRPCKAFPGNPLNYRDDIDLVVFRENTEDLYSGVEFYPFGGPVREAVAAAHPRMKRFEDVPPEEMAVSLRIITKRGSERITRKAFEYATSNGRRSVTVVEKPNVIRETSGLMLRTARAVAAEYPDMPLYETNIDAMCMWLVKNPQDYDVLVTSNMFGDILSDLAAQLVGGLGFASAGNIGDDYAVFEPTHGSAPKYEGQNKVNPVACILAARLMLEWLGEKDKAEAILNAVAAVIAKGEVRTYDMGGNATTMQMAEAIAAEL
ncbi:MAG: isocitrate/isopropylmalate dehydrogenase family protein [Planctomycetota bacterium]|nr:MAG: isocitrate/isopropylmalate dehydrogenase family protein [Planctomycetota bacterium]